ncbi:hypothetical protein ACFWAR_29810 [Streptomyces sp. NPDC059917]|uniref:hypothetical protein n=1 Tax=Streptomyces sp. NPDC059917 TaxID=3347002 RepID=UPI00365711C0
MSTRARRVRSAPMPSLTLIVGRCSPAMPRAPGAAIVHHALALPRPRLDTRGTHW